MAFHNIDHRSSISLRLIIQDLSLWTHRLKKPTQKEIYRDTKGISKANPQNACACPEHSVRIIFAIQRRPVNAREPVCMSVFRYIGSNLPELCGSPHIRMFNQNQPCGPPLFSVSSQPHTTHTCSTKSNHVVPLSPLKRINRKFLGINVGWLPYGVCFQGLRWRCPKHPWFEVFRCFGGCGVAYSLWVRSTTPFYLQKYPLENWYKKRRRRRALYLFPRVS